MTSSSIRGYFGIGVEGISKQMNVGSLLRSAHAFGAGFFFTVAAAYQPREGALADTSEAVRHMPFYSFPDVESMRLPDGCRLVGVELTPEAVELPSFRHPVTAAYVLGPERGSLSPELAARCEFIVKIPTRFALNVAMAGVLVMYDRVISLGRFAPRPVRAGGPTERVPRPIHGGPRFRRRAEAE